MLVKQRHIFISCLRGDALIMFWGLAKGMNRVLLIPHITAITNAVQDHLLEALEMEQKNVIY